MSENRLNRGLQPACRAFREWAPGRCYRGERLGRLGVRRISGIIVLHRLAVGRFWSGHAEGRREIGESRNPERTAVLLPYTRDTAALEVRQYLSDIRYNQHYSRFRDNYTDLPSGDSWVRIISIAGMVGTASGRSNRPVDGFSRPFVSRPSAPAWAPTGSATPRFAQSTVQPCFRGNYRCSSSVGASPTSSDTHRRPIYQFCDCGSSSASRRFWKV